MNRADWLRYKESDPDWREREFREAAKRGRKRGYARRWAQKPEVKARRNAYARERAARERAARAEGGVA